MQTTTSYSIKILEAAEKRYFTRKIFFCWVAVGYGSQARTITIVPPAPNKWIFFNNDEDSFRSMDLVPGCIKPATKVNDE